MPRGHPKGRRRGPCLHCDDVDNYRQTREQQLEDWRNETAEAITFKEWLEKPGRVRQYRALR